MPPRFRVWRETVVPERLKDQFFTHASLEAMAGAIRSVYPSFEKRRFIRLVFEGGVRDMELKAMMRHTTECLHRILPGSYRKAVQILEIAAPEVKGFEAMCLPDYVELYGLDNWEVSLRALALFTKFSSSEFAIRPYIVKDTRRAMEFMRKLTEDEDEKVRRFASEGCRPRLPWAMAIPVFKKDPTLVLEVLEQLKVDDSEFVRKSVANNLNDISKDHPDLVLEVCERWHGISEKTDWIVKHACRTLLKAGEKRAMLLFGFEDPKSIEIENLAVSKQSVAIGDRITFFFELVVKTKRSCKIRLEYILIFARANGKTSRKVFQISEKTYSYGRHLVKRRQSFADLSTRKHYPGDHDLVLLVNGVEKARTTVELTSVALKGSRYSES
jgi:3-methyladenine DNA glycosylase AlkC